MMEMRLTNKMCSGAYKINMHKTHANTKAP